MIIAIKPATGKHLFRSFIINLPVTARLSCFLLILAFQSSEKIQAQDKDYSVHANIIYRFTRYIDWPAAQKTGDFIIGIVGDSPLYDELKKTMTNKTVGDQKIIIRKFSSSAVSFNCEILFISEEESENIKKIVLRTANQPVLLLSESDGLAEKGSCINFNIVSDHLKLEINKSTILQRNLSIASELLQLGKIVK
jgi:hypothetical protein